MRDRAASRWRTAEAIAWLCLARLLVAAVPLRWWRTLLGTPLAERGPMAAESRLQEPLAGNVARATQLVPLCLKCLPQAIALVWMLRRRKRDYVLKFGVRPRGVRLVDDALHAWVELDELTVLGYLRGPWMVVHAVGAKGR